MKLHHYGFLTDDMAKCIAAYELLGYRKISSYFDEIRMIDIVFLQNGNDSALLELVSPTSETSVVFKMLNKHRNSLYHSCYEVKNLDSEIEKLCDKAFLLIDSAKPAIAFENRKVAFLFSQFTGIIELLESNEV